tara:strand:- start:968 stop:1771 length:804 start_codon:yes stop_codon:yes gene_type:complete
MKVLSIDIGIKNLAFVILEHDKNKEEFHIEKWNVINLCNKIPNCSSCIKPAKFCKDFNFFCNKHTKNTEYKIPTINTKTLSKQNLKNIISIANDNNIEYNKSISKNELIKLIEDHINNTCLNKIEQLNAKDINLIDLGINLKKEFNELFTNIDLHKIDIIILENQISPIANRMKTIQGMIAQYFIDCNNYNIEFMSSANKLKLFNNTKKTTYSERKKLGIKYTQELLLKKNMMSHLEFFNKNNKKDDLADCLLQGIYYLHTFNKLYI